MKVHELKTWPKFFAVIVTGEKTFDLRRDDRGFRAGDVLLLREWLPREQRYSGRTVRRRVTYVLAGEMGLQKDYVCMALADEQAKGR